MLQQGHALQPLWWVVLQKVRFTFGVCRSGFLRASVMRELSRTHIVKFFPVYIIDSPRIATMCVFNDVLVLSFWTGPQYS